MQRNKCHSAIAQSLTQSGFGAAGKNIVAEYKPANKIGNSCADEVTTC